MTNGPRAESAPGSLPTPAWERRRAALMKHPDVAIVPRDLPGGRTLPLARVRSGPRGSNPVLVLPGGPGLASVQPYRGFRTAAARRGRDVLMVEHRGVGLSRKTDDGSDLRPEDITIDGVLADLLAVLDAEGIERVCVAGSSYGSYLAGAFGARHPERVRAMILDSPVLDATSTREATRALNRLYWFGTEETAPHAARIRALAERDVIAAADGFPLQLLHESGGPALVAGMLDLLEQGRGHRLWSWLTRLGAADVMTVRPFLMEFDLVARAAFAELGYGLPPDPAGGPLRSNDAIALLADTLPPFTQEPVALWEELPRFPWPVLVLSGDRDIRTPRSVAELVVARAPHATLVPIAGHGHSALDTAAPVVLDAMAHLAGAKDPRDAGNLGHRTAPRSLLARAIGFRLALARLSRPHRPHRQHRPGRARGPERPSRPRSD